MGNSRSRLPPPDTIPPIFYGDHVAAAVAEAAPRWQQRPQLPPAVLPVDSNFSPCCNGRNGWRWRDLYERGEMLGKGGFGTVFAGTHRILGMHVAIKETKPNDLDLRRSGRQIRSYDDLEQYCQEIKVLRLLQENEHAPRNSIVLLLHEYFMSGGKVYIVTERLGWELEEWRTTCDFFSEKNAIDICRTILTAIDFMASRGVVHRDIKMPNILFREEGDFQTLKIVDFGMACVLEGDASARDFCGSIGYIAPEIYYHKSYRFEVDMFAFGVLLFRLLSGQRPFPSTDHDILRTYTVQLRYDVDSQDWEGVSSSAKDLVRHLLINREERLTVQQALNHEWFLEEGSSIIRTDLTHDGSAVSRAIAVTHSPEYIITDDCRFWIDDSIELSLAILLSYDICSFRVVDPPPTSQHGGSPVDMICIEETADPTACSLPQYIGRLQSYSERDCRAICLQLAKSIKCLHDSGIAHRDLHVENVLVDVFGKVSLRGLRYAQPIRENHPLTGHFGREYSWYAFRAPEIDNNFSHDKSVDLWSLGAIVYALLTGLPPFHGQGTDLVHAKCNSIFNFDHVRCSPEAQRLIQGLLRVDPERRFTIDDVLLDNWIYEDDDYLELFDLETNLYIWKDYNNTVNR